MKKLKLDKLLLGSLTEAQQRNVMGGDDGGYGGYTNILINTKCANPAPPPPIKSIDIPCVPPPPPPTKTTNTTPCA